MMKKKSALIASLLFICTAVYSQSLNAVIERYEASFDMSSPTSATYNVHVRVNILDAEASDIGEAYIFTDDFRSLTSFSARIESGGKTIKKYKLTDLKTAPLGGGGISDATVSYVQPVAPVPYTVEYSYEVAFKNGFISFPSFIPLSDPLVALVDARYTIDVPAGTEIMYESSEEPAVEKGKTDKYTWSFSSVEPYVYEHMMPGRFEFLPYAYAAPKAFTYAKTSGVQDGWESSGLWLYGLQKDVCTAPAELSAKVAELTSGMQDDRQKINALYTYLRESTRYVSIQLGIGGLKPFPAEQVMKTGFGDCKALSVYMQTMLAEAGVKSEYFIVDTDRSDLLDGLYSVGQMNHAMLCVPMQKDTLWIECTNPRLPLGYRHTDIAGHEVVLIGPEGGKKVRARQYPDSLRISKESVSVVLNADGSASCVGSRSLKLDSVEPYVGFSSLPAKTQFNAIMGANALNPADFNIISVNDNFNDWILMEDGEEYVPQMKIDYSFNAVDYAKVSGERMFVQLNPFAKQLYSDRKARIHEYVRRRCSTIMDCVSLTIPEGYAIESIPQSGTIECQFGELNTAVLVNGNTISVTQTLKLHPGRYPKEEYATYRTFAKDVSKAYSSKIVLIKK
ncbi:MAG: DUF3857 domain-containing protein [Bacteroidales bacterium]|nr:DUF3857 domain-containing protein [Bacteroidales bacterium]